MIIVSLGHRHGCRPAGIHDGRMGRLFDGGYAVFTAVSRSGHLFSSDLS
jgi:hypothetical protein